MRLSLSFEVNVLLRQSSHRGTAGEGSQVVKDLFLIGTEPRTLNQAESGCVGTLLFSS